MPDAIQLPEPLQDPHSAHGGQLVLEVIDQGKNDGIDIRVYDPFTNGLSFEIITLKPDSCPLTGQTLQSNATFRAFGRALFSAERVLHICVLVRFCACFSGASKTIGECEDRNSRLQRMVEDIADEILTHRPGSVVEIAMRETDGTISSLM